MKATMPGAISGIIESVNRNSGIILTNEQGNIEFTNTSDSLKVILSEFILFN